jgi:peptidoglycan/xylan/chitin deacetylase (PgdA/CDA1 family)
MPGPATRSSARTQPPGFAFYFIATIVVVLCLQGIAYLLMMDATVGPMKFFGKQEAPDAALVKDVRAVLLRSQATAKLWAENPDAYYIRAQHWSRLLKNAGIPFKEVSDAELAANLQDANLLVLPGAICLDSPQRQAIREFLAAGNGLVASGPLGARDAECQWVGFGFFSSLTGVEGAETITPLTTTYAGFRGDQFYSERVPAGYLLPLPSQELTMVRAAEPDAYWSDWMLRPSEGRTIANSGLAWHSIREPNRGRVVWFGFEEILPSERSQEQAALNAFQVAALQWASKQPLAVLGTWPKRNRAAAIVAQNVHGDYRSAQSVAELLRQEGVPGVFFVTAAEAKANREAVRLFQSAGEVGSAGDTNEPLSGQTVLRQTRRLLEARQTLEGFVHGRVAGYAPPNGLADPFTVQALYDSGHQYYLNEMAVSRAVPELVEFRTSPLFPLQKAEVGKFFRTAPDDLEILTGSPPGEGLAAAFLKDARRLAYVGGVYTLFFQSYLLGSAEHRNDLRQVIDGLRSLPIWLTTGRDVMAWWSARYKVQVQAKKIGVQRIELSLANLGEADLDNATLYLYLPYRPKKVEVRSSLFRLRPPEYHLLDHDDILRLDFPRLSGQSNYAYLILLDE